MERLARHKNDLIMQRDKTGVTPMHLAAMNKQSAGFRKLLNVDSSAVLLKDYV